MGSMRLWLRLLVVVATLSVAPLGGPRSSAAQEPAVPAELTAGPAEGVALSVLAAQELQQTSHPHIFRILLLKRWQMPPGEARGLVAPVLGYVEEGQVTVVAHVDDRAAGTFAEGASFATTPEEGVLRNDGAGCAWVLLVQYFSGQGAGTSTDEPGPHLDDPVPCDAPETVLAEGEVPQGQVGTGTIGWVPDPPALLFLARKTWEPGASTGIHSHSGPVAVAVESGRLFVGGPGTFGATVGPGGSVAVAAGSPSVEANASGEEPAKALVVGVLAVGEGASPVRWEEFEDRGLSNLSADATSYRDRETGWGLRWDRSWSVLEASQGEGAGRLRLGNGASEVEFSAAPPSDANAEACVARLVAERARALGIDDVEALRDESGAPVTRGDGDGFTAVYLATDPGGQRVAWVLRCTRLGPIEGMLQMDWMVAAGAYSDELPRVEALLGGLALPA